MIVIAAIEKVAFADRFGDPTRIGAAESSSADADSAGSGSLICIGAENRGEKRVSIRRHLERLRFNPGYCNALQPPWRRKADGL